MKHKETNSQLIQTNIKLQHTNNQLLQEKRIIEKENVKLKFEIEHLKGRNEELQRILDEYFANQFKKISLIDEEILF